MAIVLSQYTQRTQRLLHDPSARIWPVADVNDNINIARTQLAAETGCLRIIPPSGAGQVRTAVSQETYSYQSFNPFVQLTLGVQSILVVVDISIVWGSTRPTLRYAPWGWFQANLRSAQVAAPGPPSYWTRFSFGTTGLIYFFPVPSQVMAMDWDCICLPNALNGDPDTEALPQPWTDAVPYYAAYLSYLNMQRPQEADNMFKLYTSFVRRGTAYSIRHAVPNYYG